MAYNWLMMTSSGDDNRPSGSLGLLTDKTTKKKIKINRRQSKKPPSLRLRGLKKNKPKVEQETAQPTAARFDNPLLIGDNNKVITNLVAEI